MFLIIGEDRAILADTGVGLKEKDDFDGKIDIYVQFQYAAMTRRGYEKYDIMENYKMDCFNCIAI